MGRADSTDQFNALGRRQQEIPIGRRERLNAQHRIGFFERRRRSLDHFGGIFHPVRRRHARQQVSLLRRTEHEDRAAQIAAESRELAQIIGRAPANFRFRRSKMQPAGFGEQPVQADDFQIRSQRPIGESLPARRGNFRRRSIRA